MPSGVKWIEIPSFYVLIGRNRCFFSWIEKGGGGKLACWWKMLSVNLRISCRSFRGAWRQAWVGDALPGSTEEAWSLPLQGGSTGSSLCSVLVKMLDEIFVSV